jgi:hypothetical protein
MLRMIGHLKYWGGCFNSDDCLELDAVRARHVVKGFTGYLAPVLMSNMKEPGKCGGWEATCEPQAANPILLNT